MECSKCSFLIPHSERFCPNCLNDVGFPHVRIANSDEEKNALNKRFETAVNDSKARDCESTFLNFGLAVKKSQAVLCRSINCVQTFMNSDNTLYVSFYRVVASGAKLPENNKFDVGRESVDSLLFPGFHGHISFAALALADIGPLEYGPYSIVLKEDIIKHRASVFEENSMAFCPKKGVIAGTSIPAGYRADWESRDRLASAKLYRSLEKGMPEGQFANILLNRTKSAPSDFIEVHIYGPLHRRSVLKISGPKPRKGADVVMWKSIQRTAKEVGALVEETT